MKPALKKFLDSNYQIESFTFKTEVLDALNESTYDDLLLWNHIFHKIANCPTCGQAKPNVPSVVIELKNHVDNLIGNAHSENETKVFEE